MSDFGTRSIKVNGVVVEIVMSEELGVADISEDMDKVAAQMGFWGSVWAAAQREHSDADSHYRAWRAKAAREELLKDLKIAEWKLKAIIESQPAFLQYKAAIAKAEENVILSKALFDSFSKKANALQSKGAMTRQVYDATGLHTPAEPRPKRAKPEPDERKSAIRDVFKKT